MPLGLDGQNRGFRLRLSKKSPPPVRLDPRLECHRRLGRAHGTSVNAWRCPPIEARVSAHCLDPLPNRNVTNSRPTRPACPCESSMSFRPGQESDHRHRRLLPPRRERPRRRRAAECDQQFPTSDGDCHTPLPREVRKGNDTTPRACSLHVQGAKIEPKTTSTNGWLRAERDGGLTPRLGNSLASRIDLAPNNRLRSRSRRLRRGGA